MNTNEILKWLGDQSMADLSHYFAIALFGFLILRCWWLKRNRNYWKSLVHLNCTKEISEVCSVHMEKIRTDIKDAVREEIGKKDVYVQHMQSPHPFEEIPRGYAALQKMAVMQEEISQSPKMIGQQ